MVFAYLEYTASGLKSVDVANSGTNLSGVYHGLCLSTVMCKSMGATLSFFAFPDFEAQ